MPFSRELNGLKSDFILVYKLSVMERFTKKVIWKIEMRLNNHQQFFTLEVYDFEIVTHYVQY